MGQPRRFSLGFAGAMAVAMVLEGLLGWPSSLVARIGHPVTWLGRLIDALDAHWNREKAAPSIRRVAGVAAALVVIGLAAGLGWILQSLISPWDRVVLPGILAMPFIASRSLYDHVVAVARPLEARDVASARSAVAMIVGRDPAGLDEAGIARAALESLAENASDGIVAPVFWGALFGLPGIIGYKAINTLDSMIGHRTARHEAFGWASARIDDVANAAMAGGLAVRLCGPRFYGGELADEPWLNEAARDPNAADITEGLRLYIRAMASITALLVLLAFV